MGWSIGVQAEPTETASDIAIDAYNSFVSAFIPSTGAMLAGWTFVGVEVTRTFAGNPDRANFGPPIIGTGGAAGQTLNSALLVNKNTGLGGRKNRGRAFVPPFNLPEGSVDQAGFIAPVDRGNQQAGYLSYVNAMEAAGLFLWLFHSDPADAPSAIVSLLVQPQVATQRRRMR